MFILAEKSASKLNCATSRSCKPQFCDRSARSSAADVWDDDQFQCSHSVQFNVIVFHFLGRSSRAKIKLLANDFTVGVPAIRRPPQHKLVRALALIFPEQQVNIVNLLRLVKYEAHGLLPGFRRTPPRSVVQHQCGFNRMRSILGRDLCKRQVFQVQPVFVRRRVCFWTLTYHSLAHRFAPFPSSVSH
jgi:hypothetical protein